MIKAVVDLMPLEDSPAETSVCHPHGIFISVIVINPSSSTQLKTDELIK